jgi:hypothetical protein
MTGNDAAIYMEKGVHLAEGKGFTSSICRFMGDRDELNEYIGRFGNKTQEIKVAPLYIFLLSNIYRMVGEDGYMMSINILNLLLLVSILLVIFYFLVPLYTENYKIGLITIILVGFNFVFFEGMFGAHFETLSLFLFVCAYVMHVKVVNSGKNGWRMVLGYGILLALLFLSKYSSIPFVAGFLLHLMAQKNHRKTLLMMLPVLLLAGYWFVIRDVLLQGRVMSNFNMSPFDKVAPEFLTAEFVKHFIANAIKVINRLIDILFDINGLAWLFPFAIVYLWGHPKDRLKQLNWLLLIVSIAFFVGYGFIDLRYIYPVFIALIPASLMVFRKLLDQNPIKTIKAVFITMVSVFLSSQIIQIRSYSSAVQKQATDRQSIFLAADELVQRSGLSKNNSVLTNILGYNVYSDIGFVWAPSGLSEENKQEMIDLYQIDHVIYCMDQKDTTLAWDQYAVEENLFTDLRLVAVSNLDSRVMLYATDRAKNPASTKETK